MIFVILILRPIYVRTCESLNKTRIVQKTLNGQMLIDVKCSQDVKLVIKLLFQCTIIKPNILSIVGVTYPAECFYSQFQASMRFSIYNNYIFNTHKKGENDMMNTYLIDERCKFYPSHGW